MEKIYLDKTGYDEFNKELEKLQKKFVSNAESGSDAYNSAVGDGWHDNFAFEEAMRQSRSIGVKIDKMLLDKKKIQIVKKEKTNKNTIGINDIVKIKMIYNKNDKEECFVKLTGKYIPKVEEELQVITLNSPIGKAIYKKHENDEIEYEVNNKKIKIIIEKIIEKAK